MGHGEEEEAVEALEGDLEVGAMGEEALAAGTAEEEGIQENGNKEIL